VIENKRLSEEQIAALRAEREDAERQLAELERWAAAQPQKEAGDGQA
jgi:hypothetical protein